MKEMTSRQVQGYKLSPQQRRLWSLQQGGPIYRAQCAMLLEGDVNLQVLQQALNKVVNRHESLRTAFQRIPGMKLPLQHVADGSSTTQVLIDRDGFDRDSTEEIDKFLRREWLGAFDLTRWPLVRALLLRLAPHKHVLIITLPSLCADDRTLSNLFQQIGEAYSACGSGDEIADEPTQYCHFSEWQNQLLEDPEAESGRNYWRNQGITNSTHLPAPFDFKQTDENEFDIRSPKVEVSQLEKLEAFARRFDVTVEAVLMAVWQTLIWRFMAATDVVIGIQMDGRKFDELKDALGLFSKWVPLRHQFEEGQLFSDVLRQISEEMRKAYTWQEYFVFEGDQANDGRDKFLFGFEYRQTLPKLAAGGVEFSIYKQRACIEPGRLVLKCELSPETLAIELESGHQTPQEEIDQMGRGFITLLESVLGDAEERVENLNILSNAEERELLIKYSRGEDQPLEDKRVIELFEDQASRTPDAIAVDFDEQRLTYRLLNERANRLAWYLNKAGIAPDSTVGICMERSTEMVVGLLGILKAGGTYVPLDSTYPKERLLFMLEDSGVPMLLTQKGVADTLPPTTAKIVCLDEDWAEIEQERADNPHNEISGENLAYVIYTSGSTGGPKGVMVSHSGLANYLSWSGVAYEVAKGEGSPVHSPLGFDLTVTSLFTPLLKGKKVVLVREEDGIVGLSTALKTNSNYSLVKITPAHLQLLQQNMDGEQADGRTKALIIGGEALYAENLNYWRRSVPGTRLINEYGPTETVVGCCVYEVKEDLTGAVPIGRPIANTQIYILDKKLRPVPLNVVGELYIAGAGLARGYLRRPDITAERFAPNPFSDQQGARMYKTGDLGRLNRKGDIDYLGRNDHQVKIRGYRIELQEVETALEQAPGVKEALVVTEDSGEKRLIGYVVSTDGQELDAQSLRSHLKEKLPNYMVPSMFVIMKSFPLTSNGKVDRKALPPPQTSRPDLHQDYVEPGSDAEKVIAAIWREVLRVEKVGLNDNFFDLGGDSMLMLQVFSKLKGEFGKELTMVDLFQAPTISSLVKLLAGDEPEPPAATENTLRVENRRHTIEQRAWLREFNQSRLDHSGEQGE